MLELNETNFVENTKEGVVLVDFHAPWCGPCRLLAPTLEQVQDTKVVKVNVDEAPDLAVQFNVQSIPCLVFLKDGVEVERLVGVQQLPVLQEKVDQLNAQAA
jgi:thioredoxin 1